MSKQIYILLSVASTVILVLSGCHSYDNFTTYYNTYYNSNRLMKESEEEFEFQDEKKRVTPRVFIPEPLFKAPAAGKQGPPPFMDEFVITPQKLQPVKVKLDSIIIKGSKILSKHSKSDYVEGTVYLMAKSFFYQSLWLPCQIKCSEQLDRFPEGDLGPDAQLLMAKSLIMQQNYPGAKLMLSRTVDIAWMKKRWDILSEAFRLQAELALHENDIEEAIRPYKQAVAQSENEELKAKWQIDLATIYYRTGRFQDAAKNFRKVHQYSPDYMGEYEAWLYEAQCLIRLGQKDKADLIINKLDNDGKYEEWHNFTYAAKMTEYRLAKDTAQSRKSEKFADSAYVNNPAINSVYFEKAVDLYNLKNYTESRKYFARARNQRSTFSKTSEKMFFLLNSWEGKRNLIQPLIAKADSNQALNDTSKAMLSQALFELGRVHEELGNQDSTIIYFKLSTLYSPPLDTHTARYLYSYSRVIKDSSAWKSDSLLEIIVDKYPRTVYGGEAIKMLGYTDKYLIDTVSDLYHSGLSLRQNKEYKYAINQFLTVYNKYPSSNYSPKSLYATGWIFEKNLRVLDSALYYYKLIMEKYPHSDYAKDVKPSVEYLLAVKSGKIKPGEPEIKNEPTPNLKLNPMQMPTLPADLPSDTKRTSPNQKPGSGMNPMDLFKDPGKLLNNTIDQFKDPGKMLKDQFNEVVDPKNLTPKFSLPTLPNSKKLPADSAKTDVITPKK